MLQFLRSIAKQVTPMALDVYDTEDSSGLLTTIARVYNHSTSRENPVNLEWANVFPELRQWVGERQVQKAFQNSMSVRWGPHEITYEFDKHSENDPALLIKMGEMATSIGRGFATGKVNMANAVLRENGLTYDGQNLFDVSHQHPDGTNFSNLLSAPWASMATPTIVQARDTFRSAKRRLMRNTLIRNQVISSASVASNLVVICRSDETWAAFEALRTEPEINGQPNIDKNTFQLLLDVGAGPALASSVDFIHSVPGGPRPVVFLIAREIKNLTFDESNIFNKPLVPFGMDADYGAAAGFPQTCVRAEPPGE